MHQSYKLIYFDLLPPDPLIRETNKVVTAFWILLALLSIAWSLDAFPRDPLQGTVDDVLIAGTALAEAWYCALVFSSIWRLRNYRRRASQLPTELYQVIYPWAGVLVVNSTILLVALIHRNTYDPSLPHAQMAALKEQIANSLYKVLLAESAPLLAFEVPIIKDWLPIFEPMRFVAIFRQSLAILLGRELTTSVEDHARSVVEFQYVFTQYLEAKARGSSDKPLNVMIPYYDAATLCTFQKTLSCLYETSQHLRGLFDERFGGRRWSLVDVGGGEGIFTSEALASISTLPDFITVVDPAEANVAAYRERLTRMYPGIRNIEAYAHAIEDVLADLPDTNCVLASHSLYSVLDHSKRRTSEILSQLIAKVHDGLCVFILASRDSYLYTIKQMVLSHLHHIDRSSYGEDLIEVLPKDQTYSTEFRDSIVDVSDILEDYEAFVSWLSYFCRVATSEIRPHFDMCNTLVRDTAIEVRCLPAAEAERLSRSGVLDKMRLHSESKIIYHKEVIITSQR
jgi:hypothetical protein